MALLNKKRKSNISEPVSIPTLTISSAEFQQKQKQLAEAKQKYAETLLQVGEATTNRDHESFTGEAISVINNELFLIESSIRSLEFELANCHVVEVKHTTDANGTAIVTYGSRVVVKYLDNNDIVKLVICNLGGCNNRNGYSPCTPASPLGSLLMNKPIGFVGEFLVYHKGSEKPIVNLIQIIDILEPDETMNK